MTWYDGNNPWVTVLWPVPAKFIGLWVNVSANTSNDTILTLLNGETPGNLVVTVPTDQVGKWYDLTHSDVFAKWDVPKIRLAIGATGSITLRQIGLVFEPEVVFTLAGAMGEFQVTGDVPDQYVSVGMMIGNAGSESGIQLKVHGNGVLKNFGVYVHTAPANTRTTPTLIKSRVNGQDGNLLITIPPGETGIFKDETHEDLLENGDLINFVIDPGSGTGLEAVQINYIGAELVIDGGLFYIVGGHGGQIAKNLTTYCPISYAFSLTTEDNAKTRALAKYIIKGISASVTNAVTGDCTITLRKNGEDTDFSLTIPNGANGLYEDLDHEILIESTDELNWKIVTAATGTYLYIYRLDILCQAVVPSLCWGEETPDDPDVGEPWGGWETAEDTPVEVTGDPNWGAMKAVSGIPCYGPVVDTGDDKEKIFTLQKDKYGTGVGETKVYIRGSGLEFSQHSLMAEGVPKVFATGEDFPHASVYFNGYVYLGLLTSPGKLLKINANDFDDYAYLDLPSGKNNIASIVYSTVQERLYVLIMDNAATVVYEVDPVAFDAATLVVNDTNFPSVGVGAIATDETHLFVLSWGSALTYIARYPMGGEPLWTAEDSHAIDVGGGHALVYDGTNLYGTIASSPGKIHRINPATLSTHTSVTFSSGDNLPTDDMAVTSNHVWVGLEVETGIILKISKSDLSITRIATGRTSVCYGVFYDGVWVWAVYTGTPGYLVRINPETNEVVETIILSINMPNEIVFDGSGGMFMTDYTMPLKLFKSRWEEYTTPITQAWRYVQTRVDGQ